MRPYARPPAWSRGTARGPFSNCSAATKATARAARSRAEKSLVRAVVQNARHGVARRRDGDRPLPRVRESRGHPSDVKWRIPCPRLDRRLAMPAGRSGWDMTEQNSLFLRACLVTSSVVSLARWDFGLELQGP